MADIKVDNEEFWWEELDDYVMEDEIAVVSISKDNLENNNPEGLSEIGSVEMGDWDALSEILNEKEVELHKMDFNTGELSYLVFLYCEGRYVTSIQGDK